MAAFLVSSCSVFRQDDRMVRIRRILSETFARPEFLLCFSVTSVDELLAGFFRMILSHPVHLVILSFFLDRMTGWTG
jgi:hypothetical protein